MCGNAPSKGPVPTVTEYPFYEYRPLPSKSYIRILELQPGRGNEPLIGSLRKARLRHAWLHAGRRPRYEAISYVWGSTVTDKWIVIDGRRLPITTSIADALRQTRRPDQSRRLWADSVCINQEDEEERGSQVRLMGRIYATSQCTLICLGPGSDFEQDAHDVQTLISDVNGMMDRVFKDPEFSWDWHSFPFPPADDPFVSDDRWESWSELIEQDWFKRGWVVQEAALGREGVVLWAGVELSWLSILRAEEWLSRRAKHLMPTLQSWTLAESHSRMYALRRPKEAITFCLEHTSDRVKALSTLETLHYARELGLTDAKDRIYAFMAMPTSDRAMPALQPDYSEETSHLDVYRQFAIEYLHKTSDLDLLGFVEHAFHEDLTSPSAFPSWVPRWDRNVGYSLFDPADRKLEDDTSRQQNTPAFTIVQGGLALRVRAVIIDSVKHVSKQIEWPVEPSEQVAEVVSLWRDVAAPSARFPGPHQSRLASAFLDALCCGTYEGELDEWIQSRKAFAQWLQSESHTLGDSCMHDRNAQRISTLAVRLSWNRRLILLGRGYFGVAPLVTRGGDVCAIIFGTRYPFILRKAAEDEDQYMVVGPAYVQSRECTEDGVPWRMGQDDDCDDWRDWNLPTKDIILC